MAQRYDVSLKSLFQRDGDGLIRRILFGARVVEHLSTEQPQIFNRRADMVVRTEDRALHHVEFQAANEPGFPVRMLEYYAYLMRTHSQHVMQRVLFLGPDAASMESTVTSPSIQFRFEVVNVRDFDADFLLASDDWADNALALLARGEPEKVLQTVLPRLRAMRPDEQNWASATLLMLSGIMGAEQIVGERLKEVGMINIMENKVLGPIIQQQYEQGRQEGRQEGQQVQLLQLITEKFGPPPTWAMDRIHSATAADLERWARRLLRATTLEETLL